MAERDQDLSVHFNVINDFQTDVNALRSHRIYPLPDLTSHINHSGKFTRPSIKLGSGLFLDTNASGLPAVSDGGKPDAFTFMAQPGHRLGRERSHNVVFFGKLLSHWHNSPGKQLETQVAVKPTKNRAALLGELAMFQYLRQLDIPTFTPNAFLVTDSKTSDHLLSIFEKPVATMDTVEWGELEDDEKWLQLDFAVQTMVTLHSNLLFHGDLEFKNVGFGEQGDVIIIDPELTVSALEMAEVAASPSDVDEVKIAQLRIKQSMGADFTSVCGSVDEFVLSSIDTDNRPRTDAAKFKIYAKHIFRPYRESLIDANPPYLAELLAAYEKVFQDHKQRSRS